MRFLSNQASAYFSWLEDRGLSSLPPSINRNESRSIASGSILQVEAARPADPPTPPYLILSDRLNEAEVDMSKRIANALAWQPGDYKIIAADPLSDAEKDILAGSEVVLALGPGGARHLGSLGLSQVRLHELLPGNKSGSYLLLIPHPGAMLAQPQLKLKAWEAIQDLKALLEKTKATPGG